MDNTLSTADLAFEQEVTDFLVGNLTPEIKRDGKLMTRVFADPQATMALFL